MEISNREALHLPDNVPRSRPTAVTAGTPRGDHIGTQEQSRPWCMSNPRWSAGTRAARSADGELAAACKAR
jgi:hypothetical protein